LDRMAYERAYRLMAPTTRKTLELKSPDEIFPLTTAKEDKNPPPAAAKGNTAMPETPKADYTYDPKTGKLVKGS